MIKVLFVCLANICRSPSAEGVMIDLVKKENLSDKIYCDSAGTHSRDRGDRADSRMRQHALKRGYDLQSRSRLLLREDLDKFDIIVAMDENNFFNIRQLSNLKPTSAEVVMITDFCQDLSSREVPDPYCGGEAGFEHVMDLLEDACQGLLKYIRNTYDL